MRSLDYYKCENITCILKIKTEACNKTILQKIPLSNYIYIKKLILYKRITKYFSIVDP